MIWSMMPNHGGVGRLHHGAAGDGAHQCHIFKGHVGVPPLKAAVTPGSRADDLHIVLAAQERKIWS